MRLTYLLVAIGVFFLIVNVQLLWQLLRFRRLRALGAAHLARPHAAVLPPVPRRRRVLALVIVCKLAVLHRPPTEVFGESMMLVYYSYAQPLSLKIGRGFYQDGIWAEGGFVPYSEIGGLTWREGEQVTLVMMFRWRNFAKSLVVPHPYYGAARRLLRDKIAAHDIHFTGQDARPRRARRAGRRVGRLSAPIKCQAPKGIANAAKAQAAAISLDPLDSLGDLDWSEVP